MHDVMTNIIRLYPEVRARVYVEDIEMHLRGVAVDLVQRPKDLVELLKTEMTKVKLELSVAKRGKLGRGEVVVSTPHQKDKLGWFCCEEGPGLDHSVLLRPLPLRQWLHQLLDGMWVNLCTHCTCLLVLLFLLLISNLLIPNLLVVNLLHHPSRAALLRPTFHVLLLVRSDLQALQHAPPPKMRLTFLLSSWVCYHHVHDVHSILFSESQYVFRHLFLVV